MRFAEARADSPSSISVPGFQALYLKAGQRLQSVYFPNPEVNACFFVIRLSLEDGTLLWTGEELEPGMAYTQIELEEALPAGSYSGLLTYQCFSVVDHSPLNGAQVVVELEVE